MQDETENVRTDASSAAARRTVSRKLLLLPQATVTRERHRGQRRAVGSDSSD